MYFTAEHTVADIAALTAPIHSKSRTKTGELLPYKARKHLVLRTEVVWFETGQRYAEKTFSVHARVTAADAAKSAADT